MPPKQRITKEDILNAGFAILKTSGIKSVNARAICKKLNCSTQPIFSQFSSMDELKSSLLRKARDLYNAFIKKALTQQIPFKSAGIAYINFAKNEPVLFSLLFMNDNHNCNPINEVFDENYSDVLQAAQKSTGLNKEFAEELYFHLWIYVHGIATLSATGTVNFTDEQVSRMLTHAYKGLIMNYKGESYEHN